MVKLIFDLRVEGLGIHSVIDSDKVNVILGKHDFRVHSHLKIVTSNCRLSVDDANDGDSNSIQNQKKILLNYAKENGYLNTQFFVDDGYSGTSFERPSFKKMIEGIKSGEIKRVIIDGSFVAK